MWFLPLEPELSGWVTGGLGLVFISVYINLSWLRLHPAPYILRHWMSLANAVSHQFVCWPRHHTTESTYTAKVCHELQRWHLTSQDKHKTLTDIIRRPQKWHHWLQNAILCWHWFFFTAPGYTLTMNVHQDQVKMSDIDKVVQNSVPKAEFKGLWCWEFFSWAQWRFCRCLWLANIYYNIEFEQWTGIYRCA